MENFQMVAVAQDPGGAEALVPVVKAFLGKGSSVSLLATRHALDIFSRERLAAASCDDKGLFSLKEWVDFSSKWLTERKPQLVLTATSLGAGLGKGFIRAAHHRRIPCVTVLDSWTHYRERFVEEGEELSEEVLPTLLTVMDPWCMSELVQIGFPAARGRVAGQPAFDQFARWISSEAAQKERARVRRLLGVGQGQQLILFFSQPILEVAEPSDLRGYRGYNEFQVVRLLRESLRDLSKPVKLVVKLHPREDPGKYRDLAMEGVLLVPGSGEMGGADQLIAAADLCTGMASIALVKAAVAERKVLSLQPGLTGEDPLILGRMGLLKSVTEASQISLAVRQILREPKPLLSRAQLPIFWTDGGGSGRVVEVAEELLHAKAIA